MNKHTKYIAIIASDLEYFNASVCAGIYKELSIDGYKVKIFLTHENEEREIEYAKELINSRDVAGMVIFSCLSNALFYQQLMNKISIPCVFVDRLLPYLPMCNFVTVDNYGGANKLGKVLIEKGAKNIVCMSILQHNKIVTIEDRINGFRDSHSNNPNVCCYREEIHYSCITDSMKEVLERWEQENNFPDAVFAINHLVLNAFISLTEQNKNWKSATQNIILSCFDNLPYYDWIKRPIISVEQPIKEIIYYTCEILKKRIENKYSKDCANIILPVKLIDRYK